MIDPCPPSTSPGHQAIILGGVVGLASLIGTVAGLMLIGLLRRFAAFMEWHMTRLDGGQHGP